MGTTLAIVDVQVDFCPGGALPVVDGDKVVEPCNALMAHFEAEGRPIFLTRDWHPANHISFEENGGVWPPHCVQDTPGAEYHPDLVIPAAAVSISKGTEPDKEAYSGFSGTNLAEQLRQGDTDRLIIAGLTTDYCVLTTVLDAIEEGFKVVVVPEAIRAVNVKPGDGDRAIEKMRRAGAELAKLATVLAS